MRSKKVSSLGMIIFAYIIASLGGVLVFSVANAYPDWLRILLGDMVATIVIYLFTLVFNNASIYDPYWSVQPIVIMLLYLIHLDNFTSYNIILMCLVSLWGLRLTLNWAIGFENLNFQDWRYDKIKHKTKQYYPLVNLVGIQMMPTLIVYSCMLPIVLGVIEESYTNQWSVAAMIICFIAIMIEWLADYQKQTYRKQSRGIVNIGLWKRGRHPNYFGEILMWWGVYFYIISVNITLWWTIIGAFINTCLFLFISIPLAEKQTRIRHPEEYEDYVTKTRLFI